jgi:purine-nucleoside phosphorylase
LGKKALAIFTISDSFLNDKILTPEERQVGLTNMIEIAIATAEKFA